MTHIAIEVKAGTAVDGDTGMMIKDMPFHMASQMIYRARRNDRIVVNDWPFC